MDSRTDIKALAIGLGLVAVVAVLKVLKPAPINPCIKKECDKCVHNFAVTEIEELKKSDGKVVYCRCWRSKSFPYCDGSHAAHNKLTGDNVGPLIIKASS
mmetsp:Transcript_69193/g.156928  ORF Transcript_69193/g.156928 Transcript_69193/m.156928 type:complete len:100 (-) Transcript_69193:149-448(-)